MYLNKVDVNFIKEDKEQSIKLNKKGYKVLNGTVSDYYYFSLLNGVTVKLLTKAGAPLAHTVTEKSGKFTILTDYFGEVRIIFYKKGYKTLYLDSLTTDYLDISMSKEEFFEKVIEGRVKSSTNEELVLPIRVTIEDIFQNTEETYITNNYDFCFNNVKNGAYKLIFDGNKIETKYKNIIVSGEECIISLQPIYIKPKKIYNTVNGVIKNSKKEALKNNTVALCSEKTNKPFRFTVTNENGEYFFGELDGDRYYIKVYLS